MYIFVKKKWITEKNPKKMTEIMIELFFEQA
jgi:hypothetical protein